jgi:hypothetical protein
MKITLTPRSIGLATVIRLAAHMDWESIRQAAQQVGIGLLDKTYAGAGAEAQTGRSDVGGLVGDPRPPLCRE